MDQSASEAKLINPTKHSAWITTGCLLWCLSFFGEVSRWQPYSTIGIMLSPIITIIGIFYWLRYYRAQRGHYPRFKTVWNNSVSGGSFMTLRLGFLLTHILAVWTFCILFWMGLVLLMFLLFNRSIAFEAVKNYCQNNKEIVSKTGKIKYYGVLVTGSISTRHRSGEATLSFTIIGTNGNFNANAELTKENDNWEVDDLTLQP